MHLLVNVSNSYMACIGRLKGRERKGLGPGICCISDTIGFQKPTFTRVTRLQDTILFTFI